ncbi:MAG: hypothetical protein Q9220_003631 [cf. Caloplaca sp. 1 TL-2023]
MHTTLSTAAAFIALLSAVDCSVIPAIFSPRGVSGINKDGSSQCAFAYVGTIPTLKDAVNKITIGTTFSAGEKIACASFKTLGDNITPEPGVFGGMPSGICAMLCQNTPSWKVDQPEMRPNINDNNKNSFGDVIGDLEWFGAKTCGTAPLVRDGTNSLAGGCIQVDYVTDVCNAVEKTPCKAS